MTLPTSSIPKTTGSPHQSGAACNPFLELADPVFALVREGGRLILGRANRSLSALQIEQKGTANYVTQIDYAVQHLIIDHLSQLSPHFHVISEEADAREFNDQEPTWILDPVDGTTNLMRDCRHSAISLALHAQGRLQLGVIYNPYTSELFQAIAGHGAFLNGMPIKVGDRDRLRDGLIGFGTTPYARADSHRTFVLLEQVFLRSLEIRRTGSAALDLAYVACGRLDGFFEMTLQPWDYAAGALIVREAGGIVTNWHGASPSLQHGDGVLAANAFLYIPLMDLIRGVCSGD